MCEEKRHDDEKLEHVKLEHEAGTLIWNVELEHVRRACCVFVDCNVRWDNGTLTAGTERARQP